MPEMLRHDSHAKANHGCLGPSPGGRCHETALDLKLLALQLIFVLQRLSRMPGFHDDRTERDYESGGGYRSNRDVREARRQQGPPARYCRYRSLVTLVEVCGRHANSDGDITPDSNQQTGRAISFATCVEGVGQQPLVRGATETQAAGFTCTI